jgi:SagB-type dehydrogenase family enzyme
MMRAVALSMLAAVLSAQSAQDAKPAPPAPKPVQLPAPAAGSFSLDRALRERASIRELGGPALGLETISQLLWSAQGENRPGKRTVPSARARYPLELYVAVAKSEALPEGVYRYSPKDHSILKVKDGSPEAILGAVCKNQPWILGAPAIFIFSGVASRMGGDAQSSELYTFWESGAAVQAMLLQATAAGLGARVVSGVDLAAVQGAAGLAKDERVSVIVPVGRIVKK